MNSVSSRYLRVPAVALLGPAPPLAQHASLAGQATHSACTRHSGPARRWCAGCGGGPTAGGGRVRMRGPRAPWRPRARAVSGGGGRGGNGPGSISVGVGGQTPPRINDISPNDLEVVQVAGG